MQVVNCFQNCIFDGLNTVVERLKNNILQKTGHQPQHNRRFSAVEVVPDW